MDYLHSSCRNLLESYFQNNSSSRFDLYESTLLIDKDGRSCDHRYNQGSLYPYMEEPSEVLVLIDQYLMEGSSERDLL